MSVESASTTAATHASRGAWSAIFERDVPVPMRDGVRLMADIWRPDAPGRYPVLLRRTPYSKAHPLGHADTGIDPVQAVARGYVLIAQDARGRYRSEGEFQPFADEHRDGYDTVEWAARQPWSNGSVAMFGQSYVGYTQLAAATKQPPHLVGFAPDVAAYDPYQIFYRGGVLNLAVALCWAAFEIAPSALQRETDLEDAVVAQEVAELTEAMSDIHRAYRHLPVGSPAWIRELVPLFASWLAHPTRDDFWIERQAALDGVAVPALHVGGWYDVALEQTLQAYQGLRARAATAHARDGQRLIIGPWVHDAATRRKFSIGDLEFGVSGMRLAFDLSTQLLDWFDFLNGTGQECGPRVQLFVMGENRWRSEDEWPLARARDIGLHLRSDGAANGVRGDGWLSCEPPTEVSASDVFVYDPRNPVPNLGGGLLECPGLLPGPRDQAPVEERFDVLVYTSPPLSHDLEVTGPLTLRLFVSSSAVDTDFTAKLCDVHPDGRSFNLADGVLRTRYREGFERIALLQPEVPVEIEIRLGATSNVFRTGHRVRVQISSSDFPRYARHTGTSKPESVATEHDLAPTVQRVHHTPSMPSCITLPVVGRPPRFR